METKKTYSGQHFFFHLFEQDGKISMGLASDYVYPPTSKQELENLIQFISEYLDDNNSNTNHRA